MQLPDIVDADVISTFLSGTTCESLIHKLGCLKPHTTRYLLDVATNHASGEEAVGAVFSSGRDRGKAKRKDQDEGHTKGQKEQEGSAPTGQLCFGCHGRSRRQAAPAGLA